jgi:N-acetylmuramoyl-L-alanine amidase
MPKELSIFVRITTLLLLLLAASFAADPRRVAIYAPRTNYQVDILVRDGVDYVGIADLLEPLGRVESHIDGKKFRLAFNGGDAEFQDGKRQYRVRSNNKLELQSNFLLVDGRGFVPAASIAQLLPRVTDQPAEFHATSRRLFIGSSQFHFSAELRHAPSRLVLSFPVSVNPSTLIEKGRIRLLFRREPVVSNGADNVSYGDQFLLSTNFAEVPGGAEFIASIQQPAMVSIGDGGHTVTIAAAAQAPVAPVTIPTPAQAATAASTAANTGQTRAPAQRVRPFVILDAAHGGYETGSVFSPTLMEKTVNLALARRLQKELDARGIPVVLTRIADNLLTWDQRAVSANTSHASLYVALHSSASGHGIRVYTSMLPAAQPAQSNRTFLPWESAQSPYLQQSSMAASALAAECTSSGLPTRNSAAPLRPLNSVIIAAIAIEVAPLGSSADELGTPGYQQKVAEALASSIAALRGKLEVAQ